MAGSRACDVCDACGRRNVTKRCSRCGVKRYCDVECQRRAWKEHKKECGCNKVVGDEGSETQEVMGQIACRRNADGLTCNRKQAVLRIETLCGSQVVPEPVPGGRNAFIVDGFCTAAECATLRKAVDCAMAGTTHRGGYSLLFPESPQAKEAVGEEAAALLHRTRAAARAAAQKVFGPKKLWVGGTLLSRIAWPPPLDARDTAPGHVYWHVHVDQFNLPHYHYSALVYLTTAGEDFEGGGFDFIDSDAVGADAATTQEELDKAVAVMPQEEDGSVYCPSIPPVSRCEVLPQRGRLLLFSAGKENPHRVKRVTEGSRYLFSVWLTTDPLHALPG